MLQKEFASLGGKARAKKLSKKQLSAIGKKGVQAKKLKKQNEENN